MRAVRAWADEAKEMSGPLRSRRRSRRQASCIVRTAICGLSAKAVDTPAHPNIQTLAGSRVTMAPKRHPFEGWPVSDRREPSFRHYGKQSVSDRQDDAEEEAPDMSEHQAISRLNLAAKKPSMPPDAMSPSISGVVRKFPAGEIANSNPASSAGSIGSRA